MASPADTEPVSTPCADWLVGLQKLSTCSICSEVAKRPGLLPCGHTGCQACLFEQLSESPQCPVCRLPSWPRDLCVAPLIGNTMQAMQNMIAAAERIWKLHGQQAESAAEPEPSPAVQHSASPEPTAKSRAPLTIISSAQQPGNAGQEEGQSTDELLVLPRPSLPVIQCSTEPASPSTVQPAARQPAPARSTTTTARETRSTRRAAAAAAAAAAAVQHADLDSSDAELQLAARPGRKRARASTTAQVAKVVPVHIATTLLTLHDREALHTLNATLSTASGTKPIIQHNSITAHVQYLVCGVDEKGRAGRSFKYMQALIRGLWVVSSAWLHACVEEGTLLPPDEYEVQLDVSCAGSPAAARALHAAGCTVFHGTKVWVAPKGTRMPAKQLKALLSAAGARVITRLPSALTSLEVVAREGRHDLPASLSQEDEDGTDGARRTLLSDARLASVDAATESLTFMVCHLPTPLQPKFDQLQAAAVQRGHVLVRDEWVYQSIAASECTAPDTWPR